MVGKEGAWGGAREGKALRSQQHRGDDGHPIRPPGGVRAAASKPCEPAQRAMELALPLLRHGHQALLPRCLGLKHVLSPYDATYVALAEYLEAPLLTGDLRLARAARRLGVRCLPE